MMLEVRDNAIIIQQRLSQTGNDFAGTDFRMLPFFANARIAHVIGLQARPRAREPPDTVVETSAQLFVAQVDAIPR
jgi:hypothetical protein